MKEVRILYASSLHIQHAEAVCKLIEDAAQKRGTGIAKRSPAYIREKMEKGQAVIALEQENLAGFCYIESWSHGKYVAHSGLIVHSGYQGQGIARQIKKKAFALSREIFPEAKIFGLTTSLPVMKINSELGYEAVTFSELTQDDAFWKGCKSCVNYDILTRKERKHCLCTGMLYDPERKEKAKSWPHSLKVYDRWVRLKKYILMKWKDPRNSKKSNSETLILCQ